MGRKPKGWSKAAIAAIVAGVVAVLGVLGAVAMFIVKPMVSGGEATKTGKGAAPANPGDSDYVIAGGGEGGNNVVTGVLEWVFKGKDGRGLRFNLFGAKRDKEAG